MNNVTFTPEQIAEAIKLHSSLVSSLVVDHEAIKVLLRSDTGRWAVVQGTPLKTTRIYGKWPCIRTGRIEQGFLHVQACPAGFKTASTYATALLASNVAFKVGGVVTPLFEVLLTQLELVEASLEFNRNAINKLEAQADGVIKT